MKIEEVNTIREYPSAGFAESRTGDEDEQLLYGAAGAGPLAPRIAETMERRWSASRRRRSGHGAGSGSSSGSGWRCAGRFTEWVARTRTLLRHYHSWPQWSLKACARTFRGVEDLRPLPGKLTMHRPEERWGRAFIVLSPTERSSGSMPGLTLTYSDRFGVLNRRVELSGEGYSRSETARCGLPRGTPGP